jgi:hypothetical protein
MKTLLALLATCLMGCGTVGSYAGLNLGLGLGYDHNYGGGGEFRGSSGSARGNIGANQFYHGGTIFRGSGYYPDDTINVNGWVEVLLRPDKKE